MVSGCIHRSILGSVLSLAPVPVLLRCVSCLSAVTVEWNFLHYSDLPYLSSKPFLFQPFFFQIELFNMYIREHTRHVSFVPNCLCRCLGLLRFWLDKLNGRRLLWFRMFTFFLHTYPPVFSPSDRPLCVYLPLGVSSFLIHFSNCLGKKTR